MRREEKRVAIAPYLVRGSTFQQIADRFGTNRNTIASLAFDLRKADRIPPRKLKTARKHPAAKIKNKKDDRQPVPPISRERAFEPVTLLGLTPTTCRWPLGDPRSPDFGFCGAPCTIEHPYCSSHMELAHQSNRKET